jgi:hypothetical protein
MDPRAAIGWVAGKGRGDIAAALAPAKTGGLRPHAQVNQSSFAQHILVGLAGFCQLHNLRGEALAIVVGCRRNSFKLDETVPSNIERPCHSHLGLADRHAG